MTDLASMAHALFAEGKGILAADESVHTATKRLSAYGIEAGTEERRRYRALFFEAPDVNQYLSGVILFSETLTQKGDSGELFPDLLASRGIAPGIKVDLGTEPMTESPDELLTQGLIDLPERLAEYKKSNVVFTKWRGVIRIEGDRLPSAAAIHENAKRLAMYAKEVQTAGLIPMLEPEVLMEGKHSRARCREVLQETLGALFSVLEEQSVDVSGCVLKTSMVLSGSESGKHDSADEVAEDTVEVLLANVPKNLAGIVFLSGGQSADDATERLRAIVRRARTLGAPWPMTFSFARALQEEALAAWQGKEENVAKARGLFMERLKKVAGALG